MIDSNPPGERQATPSLTGATELPPEQTMIAIDVGKALAGLQGGDMKGAVEALEIAVVAQPKNPLALHGLGIAMALRERFDEAESLFKRAVEVDPKFAHAYINLGNIARMKGRREASAEYFAQAIALQPGLADAHFNLAILQEEIGDSEEAKRSLERALLFRPTYAEAHNNLGLMHQKAGRLEQAVSSFRQALVWSPGLPQALTNLIVCLSRLGLYQEAQIEVEKALKLRPDDPALMRAQAAGLAYQGRIAEAESVNLKLLEIEPDASDIHFSLGELLLNRQDYQGALDCYRNLMAKEGASAAVCIGAMAKVMLAQGNVSAARDHLLQALMLDSRYVPLLASLGQTLLEGGERISGIENLRSALDLAPNLAELHSLLIRSLMLDPDLSSDDFAEELARWNDWHVTSVDDKTIPAASPKQQGARLRVGLVSGKLGFDGYARQLIPLLSHLDRKRFELFVYHTHLQSDEGSKRIESMSEHWRQVAALSAQDLADRIRLDAIDILLDLSGHGEDQRLGTFALHPAPLQASWLGLYAGTGLKSIAYRFSNEFEDPPQLVNNFSDEANGNSNDIVQGGGATERLCYLPAVFCYEPVINAPEPGALPVITNGFITFAAPTGVARANERVLDAWAAILEAVPDARLHFFTDIAASDVDTFDRLRRLFILRDIDSARITLLPKMSHNEFLLQLSKTDVALDAFPQSGSSRIVDCLWQGIPVLCLAGKASFARVGASIVRLAGLSRWIADSSDDYVSRAISLTKDIDSLVRIRAELRGRLRQTPLIDGESFAQDFAAALESMWQRHLHLLDVAPVTSSIEAKAIAGE